MTSVGWMKNKRESRMNYKEKKKIRRHFQDQLSGYSKSISTASDICRVSNTEQRNMHVGLQSCLEKLLFLPLNFGLLMLEKREMINLLKGMSKL